MSQDIKKVGLIYISNSSDWKSCNTILNNMISSYRQTGFTIDELPISEDCPLELDRISQAVITGNFSHIAFVDHRLVPSSLLGQLIKHCKKLPAILVHIYGDFFLKSFQWNSSEKLLCNFKVTFICASQAQAGVINKLLNSPLNISTIPFPVNDIFDFSNQKRQYARKFYQLEESDFVLCYAGRISLQKNVIDLISVFAFASQYISELKLLIAGPFDDIGIPYLGLSRLPLAMETEFYTFIESLAPEIQEKITYVGDLKSEDLARFFNASDAYISLSAHNDEDFGMAPAEALCSGLPLLLSNWGGFRDFNRKLPGQVLMSDVEIKGYSIKPTGEIRQRLLQFICNKKILNFLANSKSARRIYSPRAISYSLSELISTEGPMFKGFNPFFQRISALSLSRWPFKNDQNQFDDNYKALYKSYFHLEDE